MFRKLRNQFLLIYMGTVTVLIFLFFGVTLVSSYQNMQRASEQMLQRAARPGPGHPPQNDRDPRFSPVFTLEVDEAGAVVFVDSFFQVEDSFYTRIADAAREEEGILRIDGSYFRYRKFARRIVFLDISKEVDLMRNMVYTFLWIALPMLLLIFFTSRYLANRSIGPIEESYNKQKAFIADASHELKTPLATIDTNLDVLLKLPGSEHRKWLLNIKTETARMASLTGGLLYLARMDYGKQLGEYETVDFSRVAQEVLLPLEAVFYEKKIRLEQSIAPKLFVSASPEQLRRLVTILVDNAVKYTDGRIRLYLERVQNQARLTVFNTGRGIPPEEIDKIWDRFYRGDQSREYTGGFGLGLPIARSIVKAHRGRISCESRVNEWTRFTVTLPLA